MAKGGRRPSVFSEKFTGSVPIIARPRSGMLAFASCSASSFSASSYSASSYHAQSSAGTAKLRLSSRLLPRSALVVASAAATGATARLDALLRSGDVESAVALLSNDEPLDMTPARTASVIDAACRGPPAPEGSTGLARLLETIGEEPEALLARQAESQAEEERQQHLLVRCYDALSRRGLLRAYGSADGALPPAPKVVTTYEQLRLTGLPTSAFAPGGGNGGATLVAGALSALALSSAASSVGLDLQAPFQLAGGALLLDRLLLRGAAAEVTLTLTLALTLTLTLNPNPNFNPKP